VTRRSGSAPDSSAVATGAMSGSPRDGKESLGGDDTRERMSTTLVVAWMSPPPFPSHHPGEGMAIVLCLTR